MLQTPSFCRHLFAETRDDMKRWVNIIRNNIKNGVTHTFLERVECSFLSRSLTYNVCVPPTENRFKSFAPIREGINTRYAPFRGDWWV